MLPAKVAAGRLRIVFFLREDLEKQTEKQSEGNVPQEHILANAEFGTTPSVRRNQISGRRQVPELEDIAKIYPQPPGARTPGSASGLTFAGGFGTELDATQLDAAARSGGLAWGWFEDHHHKHSFSRAPSKAK